MRAGVLVSLGEARGTDPREAYRRPVDDFVNVREKSVDDAIAHSQTAEATHGGDRREGYERAIEDYRRMIALTPGQWDVHANQGVLLEQLGRLEEAIACYEKALALVGDGYPPLKEWLARAKAAREKK